MRLGVKPMDKVICNKAGECPKAKERYLGCAGNHNLIHEERDSCRDECDLFTGASCIPVVEEKK